MAATVRTVIYLAIIVGLLVILLPAEILERFGVAGGSSIGIIQFVAATFTLAGVGLALWCALTFAVLGRGTPLPFDPPPATGARGAIPLGPEPDGHWRRLLFGGCSASLQIAPVLHIR